jgi:hypothetical protein
MTRLTATEDVQTITISNTTDDNINITTSITSNETSMTTTTSPTSMTIANARLLYDSFPITYIISGLTTIGTTVTSDTPFVSTTEKTDLVTLLSVSLGVGIPAILIVIGGLFYNFRRGQSKTKATSSRTDANEIQMTTRNA